MSPTLIVLTAAIAAVPWLLLVALMVRNFRRPRRRDAFSWRCWCGLPKCAWSDLHCPVHSTDEEKAAWPNSPEFAEWADRNNLTAETRAGWEARRQP